MNVEALSLETGESVGDDPAALADRVEMVEPLFEAPQGGPKPRGKTIPLAPVATDHSNNR